MRDLKTEGEPGDAGNYSSTPTERNYLGGLVAALGIILNMQMLLQLG
jgi:hypothetical protein